VRLRDAPDPHGRGGLLAAEVSGAGLRPQDAGREAGAYGSMTLLLSPASDKLLTRVPPRRATVRGRGNRKASFPMQRHCNTPPEGPLKRCTCCHAELPATPDYFPRCSANRSGLKAECKSCAAERATRRDKEKGRESCLRWQEANKERFRAYHKKWCDENRDRIASSARKWEERNPGGRNAWRKNHPEEARVVWRRRRARKSNAPGSHTAADVASQYSRQRGKCFWCHKKVEDDRHVDHVVPLALGGSDGPENLVVSCPSCNRRKSARHPMDFAGVMF
jgi:5-methylcytosine-specific restriction endonuclease McrA